MSVPGFGDPIQPATPNQPAPLRPDSRSARKKAAGKRKVVAAKGASKRKAAAPRAKQQRRGPAALTLNVASAFELLAGCKKKDMAAIQAIASQLDTLNKKARERVLAAVKTIVER